MFNLSYFSPGEVKGSIRFKKFPSRLGIYKDVEGKEWHVNGIIRDHVCAVPLDELHPYYTDTSGRGGYDVVSQTWESYKIEVAEN